MKKLLSVLLVLAMVFSFAACSEKTEKAEKFEVSVGFIKGPTGMGALYMMQQSDASAYENTYNIVLESDPSMINSLLVSGELAIAAVPTNVAANLYSKTEGNIKIAAINTLGVLYILENGDSITSIADLDGKTIYAMGQGTNTEYALNYILRQNGLEPGEDVTIEFLAADELSTRMAAGELDVCMLPMPAAATVLMKNSDVRSALDLTEEWEKVGEGSVLTQGCIVYRSDLVDDVVVKQFLADYSESTEYVNTNLDEAAELAVQYEVVGNAAVAKAAIPDCNIVCITGADDMKAYLTEYYKVLFEAAPESIGGALPDDDFYFDYQKK